MSYRKPGKQEYIDSIGKKFSKKFLKWKKARKLTLYQLSKELDINKNSLADYLYHGKLPEYANLQVISRYTGLSYDYLLSRNMDIDTMNIAIEVLKEVLMEKMVKLNKCIAGICDNENREIPNDCIFCITNEIIGECTDKLAEKAGKMKEINQKKALLWFGKDRI